MTDEAGRLGKRMFILLGFWMGGLGLLWLLFNGILSSQYNPNRHLVLDAASEVRELVLQRNAWGHYVAPGMINGHPVTFLLDTGATRVSVPAHLGARLQLEPGAYQQVSTANGDVAVRATRIAQLQLGPFVFRDLQGHLNPGLLEDEVLLGMTALRHLEFTQRGERLILRRPPEQE